MTTQNIDAKTAEDAAAAAGSANAAAHADVAPTGKATKSKKATSRDKSKKKRRADGRRPGTKAQLKRRARGLSLALIAMAVCMSVALAAVVWLAVSWSSDHDKLHSQRATADNVQHAEQLAGDYTRRALNYSYQNPDQYLAAITRDASPALAGKFNSASDLIKGVITEAHVVASGSVLSTALESVNDNNFHVIVVGQQTSQNDQNQQPITTVTPLRVTLSKNGGAWTITEFGPMDSSSGGIPGAGNAGPAPQQPSPAGGN